MTSFEHEALIFCTIVCGLAKSLAVVVAAIVVLVPKDKPLTKEGM